MKLALVGLILTNLIANVAAAGPTLVSLAPGAPGGGGDARLAIAIGPSGQVYEPDGQGAWTRGHAGGIANDVVIANRTGGAVIVGAKNAPPFKLLSGVWSAVYLGPHARAIVGTGSRAVAAVGRSIYALDRTPPARVANAPGVVTALAASAIGIVVQTDTGVFRLDATGPTQLPPPSVTSFVTDRWALVDHGAIDLRTSKTVTWPSEVRVAVASSPADDTLIAAGVNATAAELLSFHAGKLDREPIPFDAGVTIVGLVTDRTGRVIVGTTDGRLAVRDHGTWTTTTVREALPSARPGPPPALSH